MIPRTLEGQIAELYRRDAERSRRERNRRRTGTIAEIDHENGLYRVKLSEQGGSAFLSDWIRPRQLGAGMVKIDVLLKEGEQVDVVSESGDMTDAMIEMSAYSQANERENGSSPLHVVVDGEGTIVAGALNITADVTITGRLDVSGDAVTHNGRNIGDSHRHQDVVAGNENSGEPI